MAENNLKKLPRGGFLVSTKTVNLQFGAPPETIKDTLVMPGGVPQYFVLPRKMFNWAKGINVSDMEFPIYFNYFIKQQGVTVICSREQAVRLTRALQEAVFGPKTFDLSEDTFEAGDDVFVPDIRGELKYFKGAHTLSKMLHFKLFSDNTVSIGDVRVSNKHTDYFEVFEKNKLIATVPSIIEYKVKVDISGNPGDIFLPPRFGVT
ncbi:MAG: hypothetical protein E4H36_04540 [Spirochaetales bacterium]|nr:MAG: hypothetical protein E4H36_04540 [Spirochaetales bacterium]